MPIAPPTACVEYRIIPGFDNFRVGNDGSVWSRYANGGHGGGVRVLNEWKRCPGWKTSHGYVQHSLPNPVRPGKYVKKYAHELVLLAFVGPRPIGMQCLHDDRDGLNNRLDNLEYGTPQQNSDDKQRHGTQTRGEDHPSAKLSDRDVASIDAQLCSGESIRSIAAKYEVSTQTVQGIAKGSRWGWLTGRDGAGRSCELKPYRNGVALGSNKYGSDGRKAVLMAMIEAAHSQCPACGLFASRFVNENSDRAIEFDHRDPYGPDTIANTQVICRRCNRLKGATTAPEIVIGQWMDDSPNVLLARLDAIDAMLANPGWSLA